VAGTHDVLDTARAVLPAEIELVAAYSVAEALKRMQNGTDLVLCSVRFDDSRMFDFLGALSTLPAARGVPVICCRVLRTPMSAGARRGIELALEALGVVAFIDMHDLERRLGAAAAQDALRGAVMTHLGKGRP
jgi:hypothetical protein